MFIQIWEKNLDNNWTMHENYNTEWIESVSHLLQNINKNELLILVIFDYKKKSFVPSLFSG